MVCVQGVNEVRIGPSMYTYVEFVLVLLKNSQVYLRIELLF